MKAINIGLIGFGTVGTGVVRLLTSSGSCWPGGWEPPWS